MPVTNERLRAAIPAAGYDYVRFAAALGVDPKTVERWVSGRIPHRSHRMAAASKLGKSDGYLWPSTYNDALSRSATEAELVRLYPSRGAVPAELWEQLITSAKEAVDVLVYAGTFLHDSIPGFVESLGNRAAAGVRVRVLIGDPESQAVALRGREEGIGDSMAARCSLSLRYFGRVARQGVQLRCHSATLYASVFRFDSTALVNVHSLGSAASRSPLLHVEKVAGGRLFEHFVESVDLTWTDWSRPV